MFYRRVTMSAAGRRRRLETEHAEVHCRTALNRIETMWFRWTLNPYMGCIHRCTFCYVRGFERRADRDAGAGYGRTVRVKVNVVEVLRAELARRSWRKELVALGTATDPYQPAEGHYRLTRGCLEALLAARTPVSVTTRGPLVLRDVDVLSELARRVPVTVCVSVPTLDPAVVATTEPGTAPPRQRLRAVARLAQAGIRAGVLMAPILPGLSDSPAQLSDVAHAAADAGAAFLGSGSLSLRAGTREHFLEALARDWPELLPRYRRLFAGRSTTPPVAAEPPARLVTRLRDELGIADRRPAGMRPPELPTQLLLAV
jgi:DNA repair photolyase